MNALIENPFQVHGVVEPPHFTNRADEIRRVRSALLNAPARLLVLGDRRMGKTSVLHAARRAAERQHGRIVFADLSTASTPADMANRLLEGAVRALGRTWTDLVSALLSRLRVRLELVPDPATGLAIPAVETSLREREAGEQHGSLVGVLDALEAMAAERKTTLAIILDEFQEIHRFGGEAAEWRLRGSIQHHQHVSYVLAGSDTTLIREMITPTRAFYEMFDVMTIGPIASDHFARWIDERMVTAGTAVDGLGERLIRVAGPRTRDVVRLARAAFDVLRGDEPSPPRDVVAIARLALERVLADEDDGMRLIWAGLTPIQQNVLRAVAWDGGGLTARSTLRQFGLGHGGTARNTALALAQRGLLERRESAVTGFGFDSPFARAWVIAHALPDVGLRVPIDHGV